MYFELQLSAAVFGRVIRNRLRALPLGLDLSLPDPNGELVIDQVQIGDSTRVQQELAGGNFSDGFKATPAATQLVRTLSPLDLAHFTVPYLQIRQEVRILLVRAADLEANGPAPTPPALTLTVFPVYNVSLIAANQTQGGGPLTLSYTLAYVEFGPFALALDDTQRSRIAQVTGGLTLASSIVDLGAMTKLMKRPTLAINAGIACDPAGTRVALRVDFDIYASPIAVDKTFFEAGPADLLTGKDWAMLMDANVLTQQAQEQAKGALNMPNMRVISDPVATWDAAETTLRVAAEIKLLGVCVDAIDMDVGIDLGTRFDAPTPNHLVMHYRLDSGQTNGDQVFGCALTGALLYPFAGVALLESKKIDLKGFLGGIAFGPYFAFGQLVGVINAQKLEDDISNSLGSTCHKLSDSEYECTSVVDLVIQLVPTLNSRFVLDWVYGVPQGLVLSGALVNFGELFMGSIGDVGLRPFAWRVLGHCTGNGKNNFHVGNEATVFMACVPPAELVTARVLSDIQNGYALAFNDGQITITPSNPPVPYDCKLRVITNRGVRTLTIAAARPMSVDQSKALQTELLGESLSCFYWEKNFTPREKILWKVDPPLHVEPDQGLRQWQVLVKSVQPGSILVVRTPAGEQVFSGRPSASGTLNFSLMFPDRDGPDDLTLELERPDGAEATPLEVSVRQTLYELRASLPVQGDPRRVEVTGSLRQPCVEVTTTSHLLRWDVRNALAPQLLEATTREDTEGTDVRVLHSWHRVGGRASATLERALENLIERLGHPHAVGSPWILGIAEALYLRTERGVSVYDISSPDDPQEIHAMTDPGWFENTARSRNLLVRHDSESQMVEVYEVAARCTI